MLLITGDKGYIGSHLSKMVLSEYFEGCDLKDGDDYADIEGGTFDVVIHLAASASVTQSLKDPDACLENNALNLIPFLTKNKIGKFVFASTGGAIYGNKHFAKEHDAGWGGCISPYGQSKYLAEQIIRRLQPNHTILRLGNVYGGNDKDRQEAAMHRRFKEDNPIVVYGGTQTRDFVHVNVVCQAFLLAATTDIRGTFNIGSGEETKIRDMALEFSKDRGVPVVYDPPRPVEIEYVSLDISKAKKAHLL